MIGIDVSHGRNRITCIVYVTSILSSQLVLWCKSLVVAWPVSPKSIVNSTAIKTIAFRISYALFTILISLQSNFLMYIICQRLRRLRCAVQSLNRRDAAWTRHDSQLIADSLEMERRTNKTQEFFENIKSIRISIHNVYGAVRSFYRNFFCYQLISTVLIATHYLKLVATELLYIRLTFLAIRFWQFQFFPVSMCTGISKEFQSILIQLNKFFFDNKFKNLRKDIKICINEIESTV